MPEAKKKLISAWGILSALFLVMAILQLSAFILFLVRFKQIMIPNLIIGILFVGLTVFFYKRSTK